MSETPETDQLYACDEWKIDEESAPITCYRRMRHHAEQMEIDRNQCLKEAKQNLMLLNEARKDLETACREIDFLQAKLERSRR
jgi:hypothetical protein